MAVVWHDDVEVVAGDSWTIPGNLTGVDGKALDLSGATVLWTLINPDGQTCLSADDAEIDVPDQSTNKGQLTITVPANVTAGLRCGRYTDALRIELDDVRATLWLGYILIDPDPFNPGA